MEDAIELSNKRFKSNKEVDDRLSKLPLDIIFDIFTRLPLRTISQCRQVSRSWYDFILHPRFPQIHFAKYKDSLPCAIFLSRYTTSYLIDPESLSKYETTATAYDLNLKDFNRNFTISNGWNCFQVVATVNGLVCFSPELGDYQPAPYYIVNPITRDHVLLPKSPKIALEPLESGFGFDSLTKEYKLVRILRNPSVEAWIKKKYANQKKGRFEVVNDVQIQYVHEVEIYTLGSGRWRGSHLSTNVSGLIITGMRSGCVSLNECLHWVLYVMRVSEDVSYNVILSFNLATEEFKLIDMPPFRKTRWCPRSDLIVLDDHLCIINDDLFYDKDVWVMKVYGLSSTWEKTYVFQTNVFSSLWHGCHEVMELKNNDLLLLSKSDNLTYYDRQNKVSNLIVLHDIKGKLVKVERDFPIYLKGSLFSPKTIELNRRGIFLA